MVVVVVLFCANLLTQPVMFYVFEFGVFAVSDVNQYDSRAQERLPVVEPRRSGKIVISIILFCFCFFHLWLPYPNGTQSVV